jgi:hypothetical protein
LKEQRKNNIYYGQNERTSSMAENEKVPYKMHQSFDVSIVYGVNAKVQVKTIDEIAAENIGQLIVTKAIIVRAG